MFKVICYLEIYTHIIRLFRNLYIHGNGKSIEKRGNHKKNSVDFALLEVDECRGCVFGGVHGECLGF